MAENLDKIIARLDAQMPLMRAEMSKTAAKADERADETHRSKDRWYRGEDG